MDKLQEARAKIDELDRELCRLFEERMHTVAEVAAYKQEHEMAVFDPAREGEILAACPSRLTDDTLAPFYRDFQENLMRISRTYQHKQLDALYVATAEGGYPVHIGRGLLSKAGEVMDLSRRVLLVTDSGVPSQYADVVAAVCGKVVRAVLPMGEDSKSYLVLERLHQVMLQNKFTRTDCVVAVGGGVVGDIAGLAAATYMRGIDFYNIPTTLLAQVDSSVGGKTALNLGGVKNPIGAFKQPKAVLIDPNVLDTLSPRDLRAGLVEAVKVATTHDAALLEKIEEGNLYENIADIIRRAVEIKRDVVEADEREGGLRRVLNFGHTIGHAIEGAARGSLRHGECVAIGTLYMCAPAVRERLERLYTTLGIPTKTVYPPNLLIESLYRDKKAGEDGITCVWVEEAGSFAFRTLTYPELHNILQGAKV